MRELPVLQCSLDAESFAARAAAWRTVLSNATVDAVEPRSLTIVVERAQAVAVGELIALEGACCPFFDFTTQEDPRGLRLGVAVPPGGEQMLARLAALAVR